MTTVAIPAEGLVKNLHRSEKDVLTALFNVGGTVRTLVAQHLDNQTYCISTSFCLARLPFGNRSNLFISRFQVLLELNI